MVCRVVGLIFVGSISLGCLYVYGGRGWWPIKNSFKLRGVAKVSYCGVEQACWRVGYCFRGHLIITACLSDLVK